MNFWKEPSLWKSLYKETLHNGEEHEGILTLNMTSCVSEHSSVDLTV